jgi:hypothetical protein
MRRPGNPAADASKRNAAPDVDAEIIEPDPLLALDEREWGRGEEIELHRILASGSGPEWQRYVRAAQKSGQTLPLQSGAFGLRRAQTVDAEQPE